MSQAFEPLAWYEDEARFAAQLARGRRAEIQIGMELLPLGLAVRIGALLPRDGLASLDERCRDQADIEVEGGHLLEVKARGFSFTAPHDYPYPTAYVGAARRWFERRRFPCSVVLVSEITGAVVVAPTFTRASWTVERAHDSHRDFVEESLAVPRELLVTKERFLTHLCARCNFAQEVSDE
jgi:hypothetical protein